MGKAQCLNVCLNHRHLQTSEIGWSESKAMPESSRHWKQKLKVSGTPNIALGSFIPITKPGGEYDPKHTTNEHQERDNLTSFHSERSNIQSRY
jgi:hypothetical protein